MERNRARPLDRGDGGGRVWTLTQTDDTLWYHVYNNPGGRGRGPAGGSSPGDSESERRLKGAVKKEEEVTDTEEEEQMLRDYLQLSVNLSELYTHWQTVDPHFRQIADTFTGTFGSSRYHCSADNS